MSKRLILAACLALPLAACATAVPQVEVTRFHVGNPARTGTVAVEEMPGNPDISLEFRTLLLTRNGSTTQSAKSV